MTTEVRDSLTNSIKPSFHCKALREKSMLEVPVSRSTRFYDCLAAVLREQNLAATQNQDCSETGNGNEGTITTEEQVIPDPVSDLNSDQAMADCVCAALETSRPGDMAYAWGIVFLAKDMTETALRTGLSR